MHWAYRKKKEADTKNCSKRSKEIMKQDSELYPVFLADFQQDPSKISVFLKSATIAQMNS